MAQPVGYPAEVSEARQVVKDFGTCLDFRAGGIVKLGTANPFSGDFYFSTWLKWYGDNGTYQHIFSKRDSYGPTTMMFDLFLNTGTNLVSLDTNVAQKNFAYLLDKYKWKHLCWVHNVTDSLDQLYIDGDRVANLAIATLGTGTTALNSIGAAEAGASEPFNGLIEESVIGQIAPTWAQVLEIRNKYNYRSPWSILKYDEGLGSTATDSSGGGNNGAITTAAYITDKVCTIRALAQNRRKLTSNVAYFNGTTAEASIPIVLDTTGFNIAFWINLVSGLTSAGVIGCVDNGNQNGFSIGTGGTFGLIQAGMRNAGSLTIFQTSPVNITGKWAHVAVTFAPNNFKMYINGRLTNTDTSCSMSTPTDPFYIARKNLANSTKTKQYMKHLVIQNTVTPWTLTKILALINDNTIPSGAIYYPFDTDLKDSNGENELTSTAVALTAASIYGSRSSV